MIVFGILVGALLLGYLALILLILLRRVFPRSPQVSRRRIGRIEFPSDGRETGQAVLEVRNIYKSFDQPVLKDVSFRLHRGETLGIMGRSGSGKSVTLKIIAGLMKPDQGQVLFKERDITELDEDELLAFRKRVSYVFQGGAVFDFLNVRENIAYPLREMNLFDEAEIQSRVDYILDAVELENVAELHAAELSIGSKKQTAIGRAIAIQPEIILYDEPTTNLDPMIAKSLSRLIRKLDQQEELTSIVVTHDLKCIQVVADQVILLKDGGIHFEGNLEGFRESPDPFVQAFIAGRRFQPVAG